MTTITIKINGHAVPVDAHSTVASALLNAQKTVWRQSVSGQTRTPFCGMGVCFECRVRIDGQLQRGCQCLVREGMEIVTDDQG